MIVTVGEEITTVRTFENASATHPCPVNRTLRKYVPGDGADNTCDVPVAPAISVHGPLADVPVCH